MDRVVKSMLDSSHGQFVSVDFIKADGSPRTVTGKLAPVSPSMANHDQYINIMLAQKDDKGWVQYRNVNTNTVQQIRMAGKVYDIRKAG
jgi:hypothetical protein